ncbi:MAG: glycosyltransferase family 4 protein [Acidaminococcaceae bacterium]
MSAKKTSDEQLSVMLLFSQAWDIGGAKTHIETLVQQLRQNGNRVVLVGNDEEIVQQFKSIQAYCINYRSLNPLSIIRNYSLLKKLIKKHRVQVIHAHQRTACAYAWLLMKTFNIPYTITFHDKWRRLHRIYKFLLPDRCVAISQGVKDHIVSLFELKDAQVEIVENGVQIEGQLSNNGSMPNSGQKKTLILHATRFDAKKTPIVLLLCDSIASLAPDFPEIELVIAGDGILRSAVEEKIKDTNAKCCKDIIRYIGPRNDVSSLVKEMDIAVGTGRFALEAMAAGKPVVAIANGSDFPGIINKHNWQQASLTSWTRGDKIITEDNLICEIKQLISDTALAHDLGKFGQELISRHFSADTMTTRLCNFYYELIANAERVLPQNK